MADAPNIHDHETLEAWLAGQTIQSAVVIAVRAALRVAPLARARDMRQLSLVVSAIFRANALARVVAKYPTRNKSFGSGDRASAANNADAMRPPPMQPAGQLTLIPPQPLVLPPPPPPTPTPPAPPTPPFSQRTPSTVPPMPLAPQL
jgi:hypothetical protein